MGDYNKYFRTLRSVWSGGNPLQEKYFRGQMVQVDGWLMSALADNEDYPAPQPLGDAEFIQGETPAFATQTQTAVIYSGNKYTFTKGGWVSTVRVWVPEVTATTNYRIVILETTDPNNVVSTIIDNPSLNPNTWTNVALGKRIILPGNQFTIFIDAVNSSGTTDFGDAWYFGGNQNNNYPTNSGEWNKRNQNNVLRFNFDSLVGNYTTELTNLIPNSTITISESGTPTNYLVYQTNDLGIVDLGAIAYDVSLLDTGGTISNLVECSVEFSSPIPQPTEYSEITGIVSTPSFATVEGFLQFDGVDQVGDANTYGIDLQFQQGEVSPNWGVMAYSGELDEASSGEISTLSVALTGGTVSYKQMGVDIMCYLESDSIYTLPLISTVSNEDMFINLVNVSGVSLTVLPSGSDTIDGETTQPIEINDNMKLVIIGTNYKII